MAVFKPQRRTRSRWLSRLSLPLGLNAWTSPAAAACACSSPKRLRAGRQLRWHRTGTSSVGLQLRWHRTRTSSAGLQLRLPRIRMPGVGRTFSLVRRSSCRATGGHGCRSHGLFRGQWRQDRGIDHEPRYRSQLRCCVAQHGCRRGRRRGRRRRPSRLPRQRQQLLPGPRCWLLAQSRVRASKSLVEVDCRLQIVFIFWTYFFC